MGTYVVGDIHGCFSDFEKLVEKIEKEDSDAHFIIIGDIIDRGDEQIKMLRFALEHFNKPDGKYEMILGNHEYSRIQQLRMIIDMLDGENDLKELLGSIGRDDQYQFYQKIVDENVSIEEIKEYYEFLLTVKALAIKLMLFIFVKNPLTIE